MSIQRVRRGGRPGVMLIELLVAVLFFMLACTVVLQCFFAASRESARASAIDAAIAEAQDICDRIATATDVPDLADCGFDADGRIVREDYELAAVATVTETEFGTLTEVELTGTREDAVLFTLPCAHYTAKEARP